jgi:acyl carrier protein
VATKTEETIRRFIVEEILFGRGGEALSDTDSLTRSGIIDSTGVLEVVTFLEETFGIQVEDRDLVPENLDSIRLIARYVDGRRGTEDVARN